MKNVGDIHDCFGCGVCTASCPVDIVQLGLNRKGFYEPHITAQDKCINCGLCLKNCAFANDGLALEVKPLAAFGGWSNDPAVRRRASSGGVAFELCRHLLSLGFKVVACRYNPQSARAEHFIASSEQDLILSMGSKYIQSFTPIAFSSLKKGKKYAVVGTPCQIDSLRRMMRRKGLEKDALFFDFFCHGVPSMLAWRAYLRMAEKSIGSVGAAFWRAKLNRGWHDSWIMNLDPDASRLSLMQELPGKWLSAKSDGDIFYRLFLHELVLSPACMKDCKYKYDHSSADLRLGDLWGTLYASNEEGVSAVVAFTPKGLDILKGVPGITLEEHPFECVAAGQMKHNATPKKMGPTILRLLAKGVPLTSPRMKAALLMQKVYNRLNSYRSK